MCSRLEREEVKSSALGYARLIPNKMRRWIFADNSLVIDDILHRDPQVVLF